MERIWVKGEGILGKSRGRAGVGVVGINRANALGGRWLRLEKRFRDRGGAGSVLAWERDSAGGEDQTAVL